MFKLVMKIIDWSESIGNVFLNYSFIHYLTNSKTVLMLVKGPKNMCDSSLGSEWRLENFIQRIVLHDKNSKS